VPLLSTFRLGRGGVERRPFSHVEEFERRSNAPGVPDRSPGPVEFHTCCQQEEEEEEEEGAEEGGAEVAEEGGGEGGRGGAVGGDGGEGAPFSSEDGPSSELQVAVSRFLHAAGITDTNAVT
jgi:hypothetical protein